MEEKQIKQLLHDLKGPLMVIKGFLNSIEKLEKAPDISEYYTAAVKSFDKLNDAIVKFENRTAKNLNNIA